MNNLNLRALLGASFGLLTLTGAFAQVTLGSVADADAIAGTSGGGDDYSDNNFGNRPWIMESWQNATEVIGHIRFDVSGFSAGTVTSATLRLFQDFNGRDGITYDVFQVLNAWDEGTMTHQTRPNLAGTAAASLTTVGTAVEVWHEWDVTALVQAWVDGAADNHGMAIIRDPNSNPWPYFRSRENGSGNNPELVVNVVPEPASFAALGIGAAALLRRRRK